jgi:hypothetical protein
MSLINDALRKARLEASRKQTGARDRPLPSYWNSSGLRPALQLSTVTVVLLALALVAVAVVSTVAILRLRTPDSGETVADQATSDITETGAMPIANELATEPPGSVADSAPGNRMLPDPATASTTPSTPAAEPPKVREPRPNQIGGEPPAHRAAAAAAGSGQGSSPAPPTTPTTGGASTGSETAAADPVADQPATPAQPPEPADANPAPIEVSEPAASERGAAEPRQAEQAAPEVPVDVNGLSALGIGEGAGVDVDIHSFVREAEVPGGGAYRLDGIAWSSDRPFALVNGQVVGAGGFVDGAAVSEVLKDRVLLIRDDYRFELRLR